MWNPRVSFSHSEFGGLICFCVSQPYCSLHLHLHVSENPYTSGNIVSKESAPGIIIASGEEIIWFALWFAHPYCCLSSIASLSAPNQICSLLLSFPANDSLHNEMKSILRAPLFHVIITTCVWGNAPLMPFCTQVWLDLSWPALTSVFSSHLMLETHGERYSKDDRVYILCYFLFLSRELVYILSYPWNFPLNITYGRKLDFISALSEWKAGEQNKECDSASNAIFHFLPQKK